MCLCKMSAQSILILKQAEKIFSQGVQQVLLKLINKRGHLILCLSSLVTTLWEQIPIKRSDIETTE